MTDWPATTSARSPSKVTIRSTVLSVPAGTTRTRSPGRTVPPTIWPEKPRKSRSGRFTHCTGMRKLPCCSSSSISTVSRWPMSVGPLYQGVFSLGSVMLSPRSADIGMQTMSSRPRLRRELAVVGLDLVEDLLRVVDEVELVDGEDDVADAEQRHEVAVAAGLGEHALARVDQDHRELGGRRAGDHVARVLLVARRVGDDELAALGREEPVGDVDGDALLALGGEAVDEQREVELAALGADLLRVGLERGEVVLEHELRVVEQPPDERALAVVDAAAGDEAQHGLVLVDRRGTPRCRRRAGRC